MEQKQKAPLTIVQGATLSTREENHKALFMEDTKRRWGVRDRERAAAMNGVEGGLAAEKVCDLGQPGNNPVAVVGYKTGVNDIVQYMVIDITESFDAQGGLDMMFVFVCPRCVELGYPQTMSQVHVRQSNRKWTLDMRSKGDIFIDDDGRAHTLAGKVYCEEVCVCPRTNCGAMYQFGDWGAKDVNARPGTTAMWRKFSRTKGGKP